MRNLFQTWMQDHLLRGVIKNSSYLFSSNTISIGLSLIQGILAARLLGVARFGMLTGVIIPFASNVNRFLSFRMSEVVVRYTGKLITDGKREQAAAAVKMAALVEACTSVAAYLVLLLLTPWASNTLAKNPQSAPLFTTYGLVLLANLVYETSTGVLQANKRFDRIALINLGQSLLTAALIFTAFVARWGINEVMLAYLLGKAFAGVTVALVAFHQVGLMLGSGWWRVPLRVLPAPWALARFALSTNLQGTVNLFVRDSETILVSWLRTPSEAGYFKIALSVINLVILPLEPFINPTYAEISRTVAERQYAATRRLLKRVSTIAATWAGIAVLGLALVGWWLVPFVYGAEYAPAYPALLILLAGYGFASVFQWNRPLLLALGRPGYPLRASAVVGLVKTVLTFLLLPIYGYLIEAAFLAIYFWITIGVNVRKGLAELK